ncbi:MAG: hypothetical protein ACYS6W_18180, partial [Planctomycetota bacterium]
TTFCVNSRGITHNFSPGVAPSGAALFTMIEGHINWTDATAAFKTTGSIYLYGDIYTDRWLEQASNTFVGVDVVVLPTQQVRKVITILFLVMRRVILIQQVISILFLVLLRVIPIQQVITILLLVLLRVIPTQRVITILLLVLLRVIPIQRVIAIPPLAFRRAIPIQKVLPILPLVLGRFIRMKARQM